MKRFTNKVAPDPAKIEILPFVTPSFDMPKIRATVTADDALFPDALISPLLKLNFCTSLVYTPINVKKFDFNTIFTLSWSLELALSSAKMAYEMLSESEQLKPISRFWPKHQEGNLSLLERASRSLCEKLVTSELTTAALSKIPKPLLVLIEEHLKQFAEEAKKAWQCSCTVQTIFMDKSFNNPDFFHSSLTQLTSSSLRISPLEQSTLSSLAQFTSSLPPLPSLELAPTPLARNLDILHLLPS